MYVKSSYTVDNDTINQTPPQRKFARLWQIPPFSQNKIMIFPFLLSYCPRNVKSMLNLLLSFPLFPSKKPREPLILRGFLNLNFILF